MVEIQDQPDHPRPDVILSFPFWRDTIIRYSTAVKYDTPEPFEFSPGPYRTRDNLRLILAYMAAVDKAHMVRLTALDPIRLNRHTHWLDMSFWVHLDATVCCYPSGEELTWAWRRSIPTPAIEDVKPILLAQKQIFCGTVTYFLSNWKEQQREHVKNMARRRAKIMRGNADAILASLGDPI